MVSVLWEEKQRDIERERERERESRRALQMRRGSPPSRPELSTDRQKSPRGNYLSPGKEAPQRISSGCEL